ncbi:TolC family outer membrane protein [Nitrococcus mobilis]|uniref:TolC family outer membrane protein n=1 Tax=Nitrococcus mobilis TaxID=35797 RepID=UPI000320A45F|nr:TolC family outer membrane protein [Nitrococcus mobilis]
MSSVSPDGPKPGTAVRVIASRIGTRLAGLVLASASFCTYAGDDLLSLYGVARVNNPVLRQSLANYQAVQERWPQALAGLLPNISVQASRERVHLDQTTSFASVDTYFFNTQYSIDLTQPIFDYSAYQRLDQADAQIAQAAAQVHAAEQDLMFRLAQRYFDVLAGRADLSFARSDLKAIERQLEQAGQRFEVGLIAHTAVEEARARRDLAASRLIQAENEVANRLEAVRQVIGKQPQSLADLVRKPKLKGPQPAEEGRWQAAAIEQNWQLIAARKGAEAAMENIQVQRGGHLPTIGLTANATHQDTGGVFGGTSDRQSIGVRGELPIFQGFAVSSRVSEAQARYTQSREQLEETRRRVGRETSNAYRAVQTSIRQVQALQQAVVSNRSALKATQAGYEAGTRTIVDVLDAQSNLFSAERDYQQAQYAYLVSTLRLKQTAGTLDPQDLTAVNSLLGSR